MLNPTRHLIWATIPLLLSCMDAERSRSEGEVVRDSVGIRIVETVPREHEPYRIVGDSPVASIGREGAEEYVFTVVAGGLILSDGRVVVADQATSNLRVFSPSGIHEESWGRFGQGPGEFQGIVHLGHYRGDSLLVGEMGGLRLTVLDSTGGFGRLITPRPTWELPDEMIPRNSGFRLVGADPVDGDILLNSAEMVPAGGQRVRSELTLFRLNPDGAEAGSVGGLASVVLSHTGGMYTSVHEHFAPELVMAPFPNGWVATDGSEYAVRYYDSQGQLRLIARVDRPKAAITGPIRQAHEAHYDGVAERWGREAVEGVLSREYPDSFPAYNRLLVDRAGNVWAGASRSPWLPEEAMDHRMDVFSPDGAFLGSVDLPTRMEVLDIDGEHLLAVERGEFDIRIVQLYALEVPSDP